MKWLRTFLWMLALLPLTACGLSGGPFEGQVLEANTNKPIPGAIVIVRWQGTYDQLVESKTVCYHVETATTNADGRYKIPPWHETTKGPFFAQGAWLIDAYKAGYETYWPPGFGSSEAYKKNVRYLAPFKGTREARLASLQQTIRATGCTSAGVSMKNLYPLYSAIYDEAKPLDTRPEDKDIVQWIRQIAARVWVSQYRPATESEIQRLMNEHLRENLK